MKAPTQGITFIFTLLVLCLLGVAFLPAESVAAQSLRGSRPNIVFVLTDDQGYGQLGCHGHPWLETPNLDALHARSITFDDFQVSPTCSPTRSALMTGNFPFKNGVTHTGGGRERLAPSATTLAELLGKVGYISGIFGKWHLGDGPGYTPGERGFDEVFVHGSGGITQPMDARENTYEDPVIRHNGSFVQTSGFCTDVFFDQALGWIRENKDRPFFAYIPTNAPHGPFIAPEDRKEKFQGYGLAYNQQGFYGMVENIDDNVGRLMACLEEWGLEENTLVLFMSDNGTVLAGAGEGQIGTRDGKPLSAYHAGMKGSKKSPHEGGTRVPAFFSWQGRLEEGVTREALAAHIDILPTLVELAGGEVPEGLDGRSLVPVLENAQAPWPERKLFFHIGRWSHEVGPDGSQYDKRPGKAGFAVRSARYRLVNNEELYDIAEDPGETLNLYTEKPQIVQAMKDAYDAWWQQVRPLMVNDGVPITGLDAHRRACEEQLAKGPLPAWQNPLAKRRPVSHETAGTAPTQLVRKLAAGEKQTVVVHGTSLTAVGAWVGQLATVLEQFYPGQATVINSAQGGANSDWGRKVFEERVIEKNPDTVFIEFAVNDAVAKRQTSVEHARGNLEHMIDRLQEVHPACEIILQVMNTPAGHTATSRPGLAAYNQMYRDVAEERGFLLIDHFPDWEKMLAEDPARFLLLVPDTIHPVRDGSLQVSAPIVIEALGLEPGDPAESSAAPCDRYLFRGLMDTDKNGEVTRAECDAYWEKFYGLCDTDKDGSLGPEEYPPAALFRHVDADGDGCITTGEHRAALAPFFDGVDANGDDVIAGKEVYW